MKIHVLFISILLIFMVGCSKYRSKNEIQAVTITPTAEDVSKEESWVDYSYGDFQEADLNDVDCTYVYNIQYVHVVI